MTSVLSPEATIPPALATALADWRRTVEAELKGVPLEKKLVTRTPEGVSLAPLYTRADSDGLAHLGTTPGQAPYLRGFRPGTGWTCAQETAFSSPEACNEALLEDLRHGLDAVVLRPDEATRGSFDPDTSGPGRTGRDGISLTDRTDAGVALAGVALDCVPLWVEAGGEARPLAAVVIAAAEALGVPPDRLSGGITADPLATWVRTGRLRLPLADAWAGAADWTRWAVRHAPGLRTLGVDATVWADAGGNAVQELGFSLAAAVEGMRAMEREGLPVSVTAAHVRFCFGAGPQFFTEVAKFRAFRLLWSRVLSAYGRVELASKAHVEARTGRWQTSVLDPHVNLLRATTAACSAVIGGCDALHIRPFDELAGEPSVVARRLARNVHAVLSEEFMFSATADPAGGSWYVEWLTDQLARKAWAVFQGIERQGGMAEALRAGSPQAQVKEVAEAKDAAIAHRRSGLVGVNLFPNLRETVREKAGDNATFATARAREVAARRPASPGLLASFDAALAAARAGATVEQLATGLSRSAVPGETIEALAPTRAAEGFEALRAATERYRERTGRRPTVCLAKMGPPAQHKARAEFSAGFFAVGGFEVIPIEGFPHALAAAVAAVATEAPVLVLCSTDETYPEIVPVFANAVKKQRPDAVIVLAGLPADPAVVATYRVAGVDEFIHLRADTHAVVSALMRKIGVLS